MPGVKSEFVLRTDLLTVPASIAEPRLRIAGLAWLDMVLELFSQEVLSVVYLRWSRPFDGKEPFLELELDSSKNFRTKKLLALPDAPSTTVHRRKRFDDAVAKLMARTSPEDLWAAVANQRLARIGALEIVQAWGAKSRGSSLKDYYPRFDDSREFLFYLMDAFKTPMHPWL
ncbi:hypothetical protein WJ96_07315 [Burkholderia ubonensis]|uniref:Uncharacterized protein n=1 Tax=Burkholderia ubonensis TaxID=101571 RepID=A0AAW3MZT1_9BURK|nr:hypothetical protein [Burkholderia ubonensis]KVP98322.1 hypothetical protein WJ96_07315 [Burkholderia ubonensis]KVZ93020.1 hypothetical protein WL25_18975 [Burkholderia ubonensis]